jgi:hypothetical protein
VFYITYNAVIEKVSVTVAGKSELPLDVMATSLQVCLSSLPQERCSGQYPNLPQYVSASECLFCLIMTAIKISLAGFFLRIVVERWQRCVIYAAVLVSTTINIATVFFFIFMCGVPKGGLVFFEKYIGGKCVNSTHQLIMYYFQAGSGTLTDLIFWLLPTSTLRKSVLPLRDKLTAGAILVLAAM